MTPVITCSSCGIRLDDLPNGEPCPSCQSIARTKAIVLGDTVGVSDELQLDVSYAQPRQWDENGGRYKPALASYKTLTTTSTLTGSGTPLSTFSGFVANWLIGWSGTRRFQRWHSSIASKTCGFATAWCKQLSTTPETGMTR